MISLHLPTLNDGYAVHRLIKSCPPLDVNSAYCNFLQSGHFARTSILAKAGDQCVGFISGYVKPEDANTLFIWQVAVNDSARGKGLASQMLDSLLQRPNLNRAIPRNYNYGRKQGILGSFYPPSQAPRGGIEQDRLSR